MKKAMMAKAVLSLWLILTMLSCSFLYANAEGKVDYVFAFGVHIIGNDEYIRNAGQDLSEDVLGDGEYYAVYITIYNNSSAPLSYSSAVMTIDQNEYAFKGRTIEAGKAFSYRSGYDSSISILPGDHIISLKLDNKIVYVDKFTMPEKQEQAFVNESAMTVTENVEEPLDVAEPLDEEWICPGCGRNTSGNFCNFCGHARPTEEDSYVSLSDMKAFRKSTVGGSSYQSTDRVDKYLTDSYGNTYSHSLSVGKGYLLYLVDNQYRIFSGTVACPNGLESDWYRSSATLSIYGDDEKIAEFKGFNESTKPAAFSIPIKNYKLLKLEWTCEGRAAFEDWGDFATVFNGVLIP